MSIDWPKWKEQGELFTARFQKRYRRLLDHTYATMRLQRPTDASNYRATGLIYGLVDAHANLLYIGKTSKTMQERVTKHWSGRNTKQDRFKRHLQNLPSPPYAFILYDVPEAFYAAGGNFDKVAEPIEMAFIARLKPQFNMVSTASGFNKRGKKPRSAPSFKGKPDSGQSTPEYPRERGDAWVHVKDGQIHVDQSRGRYFGIRKQLHYMFGLDEDTLRAYDVNPWMKSRVYRVRTWVRMFMVEHLQHPKVAILDELLTARLSEINHLAKKKKSAARTPWFCIRQVSKMMDERKLAAVFRHDTELREMLADSTDFVNTRVSTSLNPPLGVLLSNFTDVSRQTTAAPAPPPGECPCQRYLLDGYHIQGHACGQAHLLKTSSELISLFDKGRKFRPDGGEEAVCREVDKAVTQFVEEQFKDAPPHFARMLRRKILATVDLSRVGADPELTAGARKKLLELQEHLVILPVDKSSHDFGFVCKRFYNQDLHAKVNHSTNYSPSEETPQQVIARHKAYLGREGLHSSNVLPYLYGTLKLHKEVTSMRYIAGVSRKNCVDSDSEAADAGRDARPKTTFSSTTDAQLDLTGLLKAIMSILRREDDIRFNATGYRYFWITESSDDTAFFLKTHADELAQLDAGTFDFTTMYDQLELEELLNAVADTINEAFAAEAARLNVDAGRLVLRPAANPDPIHFPDAVIDKRNATKCVAHFKGKRAVGTTTPPTTDCPSRSATDTECPGARTATRRKRAVPQGTTGAADTTAARAKDPGTETPGQEGSDAATHASSAGSHQLTNPEVGVVLPALAIIITVAQDVINGEDPPHTINPSSHASRRAQRRASRKGAEATLQEPFLWLDEAATLDDALALAALPGTNGLAAAVTRLGVRYTGDEALEELQEAAGDLVAPPRYGGGLAYFVTGGRNEHAADITAALRDVGWNGAQRKSFTKEGRTRLIVVSQQPPPATVVSRMGRDPIFVRPIARGDEPRGGAKANVWEGRIPRASLPKQAVKSDAPMDPKEGHIHVWQEPERNKGTQECEECEAPRQNGTMMRTCFCAARICDLGTSRRLPGATAIRTRPRDAPHTATTVGAALLQTTNTCTHLDTPFPPLPPDASTAPVANTYDVPVQTTQKTTPPPMRTARNRPPRRRRARQTEVSAHWPDEATTLRTDRVTANVDEMDAVLQSAWDPIFRSYKEQPEPLYNLFADRFKSYIHRQPMEVEEITGADLRALLMKKSAKGACGVDGWRMAELKALPDPMLDALAELLNLVERTGEWPRALQTALVTMTPKGDDNDPVKMRPITVTSCVYRLWACRRLKDIVTWQEGWIEDGQHGFRPGHRGEDPLMTMAMEIEYALLSGDPLYGLFLDFS
ncbi:hypothetical protein DIPPA_07897 [Diplonema papillatum]|nr:hypothetical protein DIPPA_07897 [Diplonema papillatum]